jgi:hypothetical protein
LPAGLPPGDPLGARLDWLPRKLTMLSVADTAGSVYPELIVGMPGFVESIVTGRRTRFFQGFMSGFPFVQEEAVAFVGELPEIPPSPPKLNPAPKFDAELVPDPDDLRPFLFPSVFALSVDDAEIRFISREAIPTLNPSTAVPIGLAALVPAVRRAKLESDRARASANLKRIAIAFQEFHDVRSHFPSDIRTKDGKPVLSWRVAILPTLGQGELFKEFHLDEPWDSAHNKPLIARMPDVFTIPGENVEQAGQTFYRGLSGTGAMFDPKNPEGVAIADILDGTSNTILLVEAREGVPWTKPGSDIPFENDPKLEHTKALLDSLGGHTEGGFHATFCDGSVRWIPSTVALPVLGAFITRAAGEVISTESF